MKVDTDPSATAPFFVYASVGEWEQRRLPDSISNIESLERYLEKWAGESSEPFPFLLKGRVSEARIHIQNLPPGTKVRSPQEAHQGQLDFDLIDREVDILGFFSIRHKGVFTHHDSYVHMHLITRDRSQMGHLDSWEPEDMVLFLPVR
jgi:acetolactate decarboxylase